MSRQYPLLSKTLIFIIFPLLLLIAYTYWHFKGSLPQTQGEQQLLGDQHKITINRDEYGIPHIKAQRDKDAFFALGYVHAQDRLWQLEVQRRLVKGELSEIFGKTSVNQDIWFRTLGLYELAEQSWNVLSIEAQQALQAYADGINAQLVQENNVLPIEFSILNVEPEPWTVYDSLAWIKVFALNLAGNFPEEAGRMLVSRMMDKEMITLLFPQYPDDAPVTTSHQESQNYQIWQDLYTWQFGMQQAMKLGGKNVGSNGWVIAGKHTNTGLPILANDPHLQLQSPSLWYAASMEGDKLNVSGMSLVGLPIIIFGRNQNIAWGGTAMMADVQDLYMEQLNSEDNNLYKVGDEWQTFETIDHEIIVKADMPAVLREPLQPVRFKVRRSRNGPIISDIFKLFEQPVALKWTGLSRQDTSFEAFFDLNYAKDWQTFNSALSQHIAPALNMLYADKNNNIGYLGIGKIPIRHQGEGSFPVSGWSEPYHWQGFIAPEEMPTSYNPKKGYIINANNKVVDENYPHFITHDWAIPARAQRIEQMLQTRIKNKKRLDFTDMQQIQQDTRDLAALTLLPKFTGINSKNKLQQQAIAQLKNWQGDMTKDSIAAAIFHSWREQLIIELFHDELDKYWGEELKAKYIKRILANINTEQITYILDQKASKWCDNVHTVPSESCNDIILLALDSAIAQLKKLQGSDISDWAWGELHTTLYAHRPFSEVKLLDTLFDLRVSNGGSPNSINVASSYYDESDGYIQQFGPVFRQVMLWSNNGMQHYLMNSTGQSGNLMSPHYSDMVEPFNNINFIPLDTNSVDSVLYLIP